MNNSKLPINKLVAKINTAADNNETLNLSVEEVKLISNNFGDLVMIPVYDMDNFPIKHHNRDKNIDPNKE